MPWAHGCVLSYCEWMYTVSLHHQLSLVFGQNLQGSDGLGQRPLKEDEAVWAALVEGLLPISQLAKC